MIASACRRISTVLLLFVFLTPAVRAQSPDSIPWSPNVLSVHTWRDSAAAFPYNFKLKMRVYQHKYNDFGVRRHFLKTDVVWLAGQSWLNDSVRDRYLPLAQLYFDLAEWKTRLLQEAVNCFDTLPEFQRFRAEVSLAALIGEIDEATDAGADSTAFSKWRNWTDSALAAVPQLQFPAWDQGVFRFSWQLQSGIRTFGGTVKSHFKTALASGFGTQMNIGRWVLAQEWTGGSVIDHQAFSVADFSFGPSTKLALRSNSVTTGWLVVRQSTFGLMPFIGWNTFRLLNRDVNSGSLFAKSRFSHGWQTGIAGEYHFRDYRQSAVVFSNLRLWASLTYTSVWFLQEIRGRQLSVQLGAGLNLKSVSHQPRHPWNYYF